MRKLLCIGGVLLTFFFGQAVDSAWTLAQLVFTPRPMDSAYGYGSGKLFMIWYEGKCGYIDETGKVVIPARFDRAEEFKEGLALVNEGGSSFFIDRYGNRVFSLKLWAENGFSEGLAVACAPVYMLNRIRVYGGECGYIDKRGLVVISPHFQYAYPFSDGLASVGIENGNAFIDQTGQVVIDHLSGYAEGFSEGLSVFRLEDKVGFIDKTGRLVIQPVFENALHFTEGLAAIRIENKYGYIDKGGKIIVTPQFDDARPFSEGLAAVKISNQWGYIDRSGNVVIKPQFKDVNGFAEGLAAVTLYNTRGYIDKTGAFVIQANFTYADDFLNGLAHVSAGHTSGYIDKQGNYVWLGNPEAPQQGGVDF